MVRPNDTFFEELLVLEEKLFGKRSISVADLPAMKDPGSSKVFHFSTFFFFYP